MDQFHGKWTQESCENVDAFLSTIGIGWGLRTVAKTQTPTVEFSTAEDGTVTFRTTTTFKTDEQRFKLGQEYDETRIDGKPVRTVAHVTDGGALVFDKEDDKQKYTVTFTVEGDQLSCVYEAGGVVSTRILKRV